MQPRIIDLRNTWRHRPLEKTLYQPVTGFCENQ